MDYKLENHFLRRSISRNRLTIEVSVLGEIIVLFHAPLVMQLIMRVNNPTFAYNCYKNTKQLLT